MYMKLWGIHVTQTNEQGSPVWEHPCIVKAETGLEAAGKAYKRVQERSPYDLVPGGNLDIQLLWGEVLNMPASTQK